MDIKTLYKDFGSRVRQTREEKNISPKELALAANLTVHFLQKIERGAAGIISCKTAANLACRLGVSLDYLAGRTDIEAINR